MSARHEDRIFLSDSEKRTAERILANPQALDVYDSRQMKLARTMLAELEPALLAFAVQGALDEQSQAGSILIGLGAASGLPLILEGLRRGDLQQQKAALVVISSSPLKADGVPLAGLADVVTTIRPLLDSRNSHLRELAARALINATHGEPEEMRTLLRYGDPKLQQLGALALVKHAADPEAWQVIRVLLAWIPRNNYHDRYGLLHALLEFAASSDPHLREDVAHLIRGELIALARRSDDNYADNEVMTLLETLEKFEPAWEIESLELILASQLGWSRGLAFKRICKRAEGSALPRVLAALQDDTLAKDALELIRSDPGTFSSNDVVGRLIHMLSAAEGERERSTIAQTLVSLGQVGLPEVIAAIEIVEPWLRWEILTYRLGLDFDAVADLLVSADFPAENSGEARQCWAEGERQEALIKLMTPRLCGFDTEDSQVPPDYPGLVMSLAERGPFPIVSARLYERGDQYELDLEMPSTTTTFPLQRQGDWIDVPGLLHGLNALLARIGSTLRYHALHTGGQGAMIVLANAEGVARLVRDYAFPIGDPGQAAAQGQAYERYVVGKPYTGL